MNKYRILIHGKNFMLKFEESIKLYGFYTTRYIEAKDSELAKEYALDLIRNELREHVLNEQANPPIMYIEEAVEIESFEGISVPGKGFTFYPDDDK